MTSLNPVLKVGDQLDEVVLLHVEARHRRQQKNIP